LIKLKRESRIRHNAFINIMQGMKDDHGILGSELFGFDVISCNSVTDNESLTEHPGFKIIVDIMNKSIFKLEIWMKEGDLITNRKGLLWKYVQSTAPAEMTRSQLIRQVEEWKPVIKEYEELKQVHSLLLTKHSEVESAYQNMLACYETERSMNAELIEKLKAKIRECGELQRELIHVRPMGSQ
jgi:hypothetical protein